MTVCSSFAEKKICFSSVQMRLQNYDTEYEDCVNGLVVNKTVTRRPPRNTEKPTVSTLSNSKYSSFNGSNTLGTTKICSRQWQFELTSVNQSARS